MYLWKNNFYRWTISYLQGCIQKTYLKLMSPNAKILTEAPNYHAIYSAGLMWGKGTFWAPSSPRSLVWPLLQRPIVIPFVTVVCWTWWSHVNLCDTINYTDTDQFKKFSAVKMSLIHCVFIPSNVYCTGSI